VVIFNKAVVSRLGAMATCWDHGLQSPYQGRNEWQHSECQGYCGIECGRLRDIAAPPRDIAARNAIFRGRA